MADRFDEALKTAPAWIAAVVASLTPLLAWVRRQRAAKADALRQEREAQERLVRLELELASAKQTAAREEERLRFEAFGQGWRSLGDLVKFMEERIQSALGEADKLRERLASVEEGHEECERKSARQEEKIAEQQRRIDGLAAEVLRLKAAA